MGERGQFLTESEPARTVPHGVENDVGASRGDGFAGRPVGGRQTECSGVSGTSDEEGGVLTRQPPDRRGVGRSEESEEPNCGSSPAAQRDSETEDRMGGQTRAARGRDRGGGRPDTEALQDGGGIAAAGRRTAASRRGPTRRQLADSPGIPHLVTYRIRFALWLGLALPHLPLGPSWWGP